MEYVLVFLLFAIITLIEPVKENIYTKSFFLLFFYLITLLFVGLRDKTGTDWFNYLNHFNDVFIKNDYDMEIGYVSFVKIVKFVFDDYHALVFCIALLYLSIFYCVLYKKSNVGIIFLLFFSGQLFGLMGTNRQIIAIFICLLAGEYLYRDKYKLFIFLVCLASLFHISALIFLLMLFVKKYYKRFLITDYLKIISIGLCFAIFIIVFKAVFLDLVFKLGFIGGKVSEQIQVYTSSTFQATETVQILVVIKRLLILGLVFTFFYLFVCKKLNKSLNIVDDRFKYYLLGYILSIVIVALFQSTLSIIAVRGSAYFYIYEIFLFALIADKIKPNKIIIYKLVIILFCAARLSTQFMVDSNDFIPYKAVWYNTDVIRSVY